MAKYAIVNAISYSDIMNDTTFVTSAISANGSYDTYISTGINAGTWKYNTAGTSGDGIVYMVKLANDLADTIFPPTSTDSIRAMYCLFTSQAGNYFRSGFRRTNGTQAVSSVSTTFTIFGNEYYGTGAYDFTSSEWNVTNFTGIFSEITEEISTQSELETLLTSLGIFPIDGSFPITYSFINSAVSGPASARIGDTVIVSAVPDVGYGITDSSTQILVTNNDIAVPYTWDAVNNRITFTMPDPT